MYAVLPSQIEPGFGYIALYRPEQDPAPNLGKPDPNQPYLGVSQVGPPMWHAPVGRAPQGNLSSTRIHLVESNLDSSRRRVIGGGYGGYLGR